MKSDTAIRGLIRHRAKKMLLEGKSDMVRFVYDGNRVLAIFEHDGQQAVYEAHLELQSAPTAELAALGLIEP